MANELKPCPFCNSNRVTVHKIRDGQQAICKDCCATGAPIFHGKRGPEVTHLEAVEAWNTRPAAPVEGVETVKWQVKDFADSWFTVDNELGAQAAAEHYGSLVRELVTRSQAEELLAAERKEKEWAKLRADDWKASFQRAEADNAAGKARYSALEEIAAGLVDRTDKAEADNAALTARVKEVEKLLEITERTARNELKQSQALETQLAAARSALTMIAKIELSFPEELRDIARAALEDKP